MILTTFVCTDDESKLDYLLVLMLLLLDKSTCSFVATFVLLFGASLNLHADEPVVDFARDVLPIFSDRCFQCHGPDANEGRKGDLRLDDEADAKRDRGGYAAVTPGDLEASEIWYRIEADEMPPEELGRPLTDEEKQTIRQWVEQGAKWGKHWSFEQIVRPPMPAETEHVHPIDALINRRLVEEEITPTTPASRETLIRRLSLDLTGLPPSPQQVERFLNDTGPDAWQRLVDRTLQSPAYGERMAWDWLDAARYADSNGYQGDRERTMWPWRDWVVRAFNENLPYDQFTIWQLAGDLLPEPTQDQLVATGFNRNHMINGEGGRIAEENRVDYVMDMAETAGTVWLGLTFNCCRCHDHKFDPLAQREYYQLTAFFNQTPVDGSGGDPQTKPVVDVPTSAQQRAIERLQRRIDQLNGERRQRFAELADQREQWEQQQLASETDAEEPTEDVEDPSEREKLVAALRVPKEKRTSEQKEAIESAFRETDSRLQSLEQSLEEAREQLGTTRGSIPKVMVMADREEPRPTYILERGLYNQRGEQVVAGVPAALPPLDNPSDADRLDLARWLVSRDHPLTSRVTVNRFWQMLFGIGLVKTVEDFGAQSEYPVHPELLDWLAAEFIESGWDVKHLLRTIVTSEAYRRSSAAPRELYQRDPDNRLLARGPRFRMPAWMIRDQALAASGLANYRVGGSPVRPYQPEGVWAEATFGKKVYSQDAGGALYRRSLYTFWRRIVGPTVLFDSAKRQVCEVKPLRTNTPMHALTTMNDVTYVEAARALAADILLTHTADEKRMGRLGQRLLCRTPSVAEMKIWQRSLDRATNAFQDDPSQAERLLQHGESPRREDLPTVEHAAWTALCLNILNLDETVTKE